MQTVNRIFCVGQNYRRHIKELNNAVPDEPVIFMKPPGCIVPVGQTIAYPSHGHELHHEVELVFRMGSEPRSSAAAGISDFTLGLDLTLRDVQQTLRGKGLPWEKAKAFPQSAPLGNWVPLPDEGLDLQSIPFSCRVNNVLRQEGNSKDMIFPVCELIRYIDKIWRLGPGDIIFTGTPEGIGPLLPGDSIEINSPMTGSFNWRICDQA